VIQAGVGKEVRLIRSPTSSTSRPTARYTGWSTRTRADGEALIRTPLKELLAQLDERDFWQVHRSVIVARRHVAAAVRMDEGVMHLTLRGRDDRAARVAAFPGPVQGAVRRAAQRRGMATVAARPAGQQSGSRQSRPRAATMTPDPPLRPVLPLR
jgi:hypothetical protein